LFDNYVDECEESIIESNIEDFEIFVGEPISYESSFDESVISEKFERPVFCESLFDLHSYANTSFHLETVPIFDSPNFDEYPCETLTFDNPLKDEICTESTHTSCSFSELPPSPLSSCHLVDLENQLISFHEGPHDIVHASYNWPYEGNSYVSPVHLWIEACCDHSFPLGDNFNKVLCANNHVFYLKFINE